MTTQYIFVAEITRAVDSAGTTVTSLACTGEGFVTRPTDTPANMPVPPTLMDPSSYRREMFSGDTVFGAVRPAFGEVVLYNGDGRYDGWEHHGFDGRPFVLRWGPLGGAYPADFATVVICTVDGITLTETEARLRLRDNTQLLDKSFLKDAFDGSSVAEGSGGLQGQAKTRYIGTPRWTGPQPLILADSFGKTTYFVSTGRGNPARVWDNGNEISHQNVVGDFWAVSPGPDPGYFWQHYDAAGTYIRLGTRAVGDVRVYMTTKQADGAPWSMQALLAEAGYTGALQGAPLPGINLVVADPGTTYARVFDDAATVAGMWYGFDRLGRFVSKVFDAPSGTPVLTLSRSNCISVKRSPTPGLEVPLYQLSVNATQTWKSQYTSPTNYVRDYFLAEQWLQRFTYSDDAQLVKHKAAKSLHFDLLIAPADFAAWRARYMALFGVERSLITAVVPLSADSLAVDLGDVVMVQWPRFNLSDGRLLRVVSVRYALRERQIEFALWG